MMTLISLVLFAAAFATTLAVFWFTLVPALPRIGELLAGEAVLAPIPTPVARRQAAMASHPARAGLPSWRAAA